jgi:hypothetical protein
MLNVVLLIVILFSASLMFVIMLIAILSTVILLIVILLFFILLIAILLNVILLIDIFLSTWQSTKYHFSESHFTEWQYGECSAKYKSPECHSADKNYFKSHSAQCRFTECRGAHIITWAN